MVGFFTCNQVMENLSITQIKYQQFWLLYVNKYILKIEYLYDTITGLLIYCEERGL